MMKQTNTTTGEGVVIPREFEQRWLRDNDYADSPDFGGARNYCYLPERHAAHGRIYRYQRGGYYDCWQCVKAAMMSAYIDALTGNETEG